MNISVGWIKQRAFGIEAGAATFAQLGFHEGAPATLERLQHIAGRFVHGYNTSLRISDLAALARELDQVELDFRGFAYEGAAMGLTLLDRMAPWRKSALSAFIHGPGQAYAHVAYIGAGWAFARLRRRNLDPFIARTDPLLAWLAVDGYGFHEGFFRAQRYIRKRVPPLHLSGYARRAFDQGLGRSMWFINCAEPARIATMIAGFAPQRHADLWSGVGLACAYAGGIDRETVAAVRAAGAAYLPQMAQGACFAAKARQVGGNVYPHTDLACEMLCGLSAVEAAGVLDTELTGVTGVNDPPAADREPAYERWRQRVQARFANVQPAAAAGERRAAALS